MAWQGNRTRPVRKAVTFTEQEWRYVRDSQVMENRRRAEAGLETVGWTRFARARIMTGRAVTLVVPPGLDDVAAQLARIGGNVNQIAHTVNIAGVRSTRRSSRFSGCCGRRWACFR